MNIPVVQLSLPELSGERGAEVARHCLEAGFQINKPSTNDRSVLVLELIA